jgi:hypothetical protein
VMFGGPHTLNMTHYVGGVSKRESEAILLVRM